MFRFYRTIIRSNTVHSTDTFSECCLQHSLNVPVLCTVFDLMMVDRTETYRQIFNIDY